jgi:hypothetical protein
VGDVTQEKPLPSYAGEGRPNGNGHVAGQANQPSDIVIRIPYQPEITYAQWLKLTAKITGFVARELEKIG